MVYLLSAGTFIRETIESILRADADLFLKINGKWTCRLADTICPFLRQPNNWIPLYILLGIFATYHLRRRVVGWVLFFIVTVVLTDQFSLLLKNLVKRQRPCQDPAMIPKVRLLLDHCAGAYSFTSSHAANHFGMAVFIIMTLGAFLKNWKYLFLVWAALISYSQVYVGIHYPLDVICGGLLGAALGYLTYVLHHRIFIGSNIKSGNIHAKK